MPKLIIKLDEDDKKILEYLKTGFRTLEEVGRETGIDRYDAWDAIKIFEQIGWVDSVGDKKFFGITKKGISRLNSYREVPESVTNIFDRILIR